MLALSRKVGESIVISGGIKIMVVGLRGDKVRLGIEAPRNILVNREEIQAIIDAKTRKDSGINPSLGE